MQRALLKEKRRKRNNIGNEQNACILFVSCAGFAPQSGKFPMQIRAHPPEGYSHKIMHE